MKRLISFLCVRGCAIHQQQIASQSLLLCFVFLLCMRNASFNISDLHFQFRVFFVFTAHYGWNMCIDI